MLSAALPLFTAVHRCCKILLRSLSIVGRSHHRCMIFIIAPGYLSLVDSGSFSAFFFLALFIYVILRTSIVRLNHHHHQRTRSHVNINSVVALFCPALAPACGVPLPAVEPLLRSPSVVDASQHRRITATTKQYPTYFEKPIMACTRTVPLFDVEPLLLADAYTATLPPFTAAAAAAWLPFDRRYIGLNIVPIFIIIAMIPGYGGFM